MNFMTKDEAFKIAVRMLIRTIVSYNSDTKALETINFLNKAEAEKDYDKIYTSLEELKEFIVKLQLLLKKK